MKLTLGSLFDGIGGWQLAAVHAGVKPIWSSEIEKFPLAVTRKRFPDTKQLGDVTKITDVEPVDIVCAGSPCQDLSIAGKREGLAGERSGLFINAINIVRQMRMSTGGRQPRFFVWENVPGAFTSGSERGADFRAVLESIAETDIPMPKDGRWANAGMVQCPKCEIAWRTLDAQFWGVPQRRRRIFLVADFAATDRRAGKILFVEQSVPRDTAARRTAWEDASTVAKNRARTSSWCVAGNIINRKDKNGGHHLGVDKDVSFTLNTIDRHAVFSENEKTYSVQAIGHIVESEKSSTLVACDYKSPRNFVEYSKPELASGKPCTETLMANASTKLWLGNQEAFSGNYFVIDKQQEVPLYDISHRNDGVREIPRGACNTLDARMGTGGNQVPILTENIPKYIIMGHDVRSARFHTETTDPLMACDYKQPPIVATIVFEPGVATRDGGHVYTEMNKNKFKAFCKHTNCLYSAYGTKWNGNSAAYNGSLFVKQVVSGKVRRLTPLECERLQGLPDGWTNGGSDTVRYKAIGNGMAQPVADWVIKRIVEEMERD